MTNWFPAVRWTALLALPASLLLLLTGCGSGGSIAPPTTPEPTSIAAGDDSQGEAISLTGTYTDPDKDYQLILPAGWTQDAAQSSDDRAVFVSADGTRSVELEKQKADPNLLAYSRSDFGKTYKSALEDFKLQSFSTVTANGSTGVALRYTCTKSGSQYQVVQYVMAGDYDYSVTYSAVGGDITDLAAESIATFRELDPDHDPSLLADRLNGAVYTDGSHGYTVTVPDGWRVTEQAADRVTFSSGDKKRNINIGCSDMDTRLFSYQKDYFTQQFQAAFGTTATVTSFSTTTVNGRQALYLACTYTYGGKSLTARQYSINSGDTTYTITHTSQSSGSAKADLDAVVKSLTLPEE